jgi:hypothetical protein
MSSNYASIRPFSPLVTEITLSVIKQIKSTCISREEKICINADLVPRVSERVMQASMTQRMIPSMMPSIEIEEPKKDYQFVKPDTNKFEYNIPKRDMSKLIEPMRERYRAPVYTPTLMIPQSLQMNEPMPQALPESSQGRVPEMLPQDMEVVGDYGKINDFLRDPTVSSVECPGPGKPISIVRTGQRQMTRIFLSPEEIEGILKNASEASHIPLLEGVFRAAAENFTINAVISEMIGSRFVIKKNTPYALLDVNPYS